MEKLTLTARVVEGEGGYLATIENLEVTGTGATAKDAQDDLVVKFMSWVQASEGQANLEKTLLEAGYADVEEGTELELQFVE